MPHSVPTFLIALKHKVLLFASFFEMLLQQLINPHCNIKADNNPTTTKLDPPLQMR